MENAHLLAEGMQEISSATTENYRPAMDAMDLETLITRCMETVAECERLFLAKGNDDALEKLCAQVIQIDNCIVAYPVSTLAVAQLKANHLLQMQDQGFDDFNGDDCFRSLLRSLTGNQSDLLISESRLT